LIEWHLLRPIAYFALLVPATLAVFLGADAALKRRVLTWYALGARVHGVFWAISAALALLLALLVIPLLNALLFPHIYAGGSAAALAGAGLALLVAAIAGAVFRHCDARLAARCPRCRAAVAGRFCVGRTCQACGQPLHAWLVAAY
jgi:hypothetical protein